MVVKLLFNGLRRTRKHEASPGKAVIGVLTFEVSSLMSKFIHLWRSLTDKQISRLRNEIMNSEGVKNLVSEDRGFISEVLCAEMAEILGDLARSVARLGKKCNDPALKSFEGVFDGLVKLGADPYGWVLSAKKMERTANKMEWLVFVSTKMYHELEMLSELEQSARKTAKSDEGFDAKSSGVHDWEMAFLRRKHAVKGLQDCSLWNRTYDYAISLLARSTFSVFKRIKHVFCIDDLRPSCSQFTYESNSLYALMLSCEDDPSEGSVPFFSAGSKPCSRMNKPFQFEGNSPACHGRKPNPKSNRLAQVQPFKDTKHEPIMPANLPGFIFKMRAWKAPPGTLGAAAMARHYANLILEIDRLMLSPYLIGQEARDDLYDMLPASVRRALRLRLWPCTRSLSPSILGSGIAGEFSQAMAGILGWLAPLAHNTVRWQSEWSFERHDLDAGPLVFLVQTLHFANQEKTEAAVVELLVGLNYVWRFGREPAARALVSSASGSLLDEYLDLQQQL